MPAQMLLRFDCSEPYKPVYRSVDSQSVGKTQTVVASFTYYKYQTLHRNVGDASETETVCWRNEPEAISPPKHPVVCCII